MARTPIVDGFVLYDCPVARFQHLASGKHKLRIVWDLRNGPLRYGEIKKSLLLGLNGQHISPRILSRELKALTALGLIARKDYGTVPLRVEYRLTPLG
ncbi:MAG: winged helix-turn-helix transcriptional regulator, partial [Actinomycetota bacterium]